MCNLYSITTNQEAIARFFRVINRYVGNLPPMPGMFPDYPAPVVRNDQREREMAMMRWGMPPPPRTAALLSPTSATRRLALARLAEAREPLPGAVQLLRRVRAGAEP